MRRGAKSIWRSANDAAAVSSNFVTEWSNPAYAAVEADGGAGLPHRDADPVMRLSAHYNEPAKFMREQFERLDSRAATGTGLSRAKVMERRYYLMAWLAGLYVTLEGVEQLPLADVLVDCPLGIPALADRIPPLLVAFTLHRDSLRLLRNAQAHYQRTASKHVQFFDSRDRLDWAGYIQGQLDRLFSDYRVECAIVCAIAGRRDEIDMGRRPHASARLRYLKP